LEGEETTKEVLRELVDYTPKKCSIIVTNRKTDLDRKWRRRGLDVAINPIRVVRKILSTTTEPPCAGPQLKKGDRKIEFVSMQFGLWACAAAVCALSRFLRFTLSVPIGVQYSHGARLNCCWILDMPEFVGPTQHCLWRWIWWLDTDRAVAVLRCAALRSQRWHDGEHFGHYFVVWDDGKD
jgi:hypothetical protein